MKGYIISFSAIILLSSMMLFSVFYSQNAQDRNYSFNDIKKYSKAEFVKDDLGFDLSEILGTQISIQIEPNLEITFIETLPAEYSKIAGINKFKEFAETSYSAVNNTKIKIGSERISSSVPVKFSNGLVYEYGFGAGSSAEFFAENRNTNAVSIDLNLNVNASSIQVNETLFTSSPDLTVNFNYSDLNSLNEKHEILQVNSLSDNVIVIRFSGSAEDVIEIHFGSFEGKINAVRVWNKTFGQKKTLLALKAVMPQLDLNSGLKVFADIDLNYFQQDLNSSSLIELKKFS
ncbi:MAG: hypothetical protein ABH986_00390 [archaeon]